MTPLISGLINAAGVLLLLGIAAAIVVVRDRKQCAAFYNGRYRCERRAGHKNLHYSHSDYGWYGIVHRTW